VYFKRKHYLYEYLLLDQYLESLYQALVIQLM